MNTITKPWGWEEPLGTFGEWRLKKIHINEGHRTSFQYHKQSTEVWFFPSGGFFIVRPNESHRLSAKNGTILEITRADGSSQTILTKKDSPLEVLELKQGDDSDIVRIEDDYGRT